MLGFALMTCSVTTGVVLFQQALLAPFICLHPVRSTLKRHEFLVVASSADATDPAHDRRAERPAMTQMTCGKEPL
ncbi:hypothetical protein [Deinococcus malanensis]|uniref:hypothetical protein n=1 Tax=Deinococcus malanensis TaxID=1706855 RepID=UPI00166AB533|nr:hypothetical protein [Deinococcus malanensis]